MKKRQTRLTNHQIQVLAFVCDDMPMKAIAVTLGRSIKTVEKHRQKINKFAGAHSPIGLYKWAIANGYVEAPVRIADYQPEKSKLTLSQTGSKSQIVAIGGSMMVKPAISKTG